MYNISVMNRLSIERRAKVISALVEGNSIQKGYNRSNLQDRIKMRMVEEIQILIEKWRGEYNVVRPLSVSYLSAKSV